MEWLKTLPHLMKFCACHSPPGKVTKPKFRPACHGHGGVSIWSKPYSMCTKLETSTIFFKLYFIFQVVKYCIWEETSIFSPVWWLKLKDSFLPCGASALFQRVEMEIFSATDYRPPAGHSSTLKVPRNLHRHGLLSLYNPLIYISTPHGATSHAITCHITNQVRFGRCH